MTKKYSPGEIRNLAICGHGSAGKTTLVDQLLFKTGAITHPVSVDNGKVLGAWHFDPPHFPQPMVGLASR
jgi:elongation factor G